MNIKITPRFTNEKDDEQWKQWNNLLEELEKLYYWKKPMHFKDHSVIIEKMSPEDQAIVVRLRQDGELGS